MKWITGDYNSSLKDLLTKTKWLSVHQLTIYHSVLLYWKVLNNSKPERLVRRLNISEDTIARIYLTERVWSRIAERYYRMVENSCIGVTRVSSIKRILCQWIKSKIPLHED